MQRFELLEKRELLAGDFANSLVDETSMHRILDGIDSVSVWANDFGGSGALAEPLALVTTADGTRLSVNEFADLGASFDTIIAAPLRTYMETLPENQRDTNAIVDFVAQLPGVVGAGGGLTCASVDEIRFEVEFQDEFSISNLGVDLGTAAQSMNLSIDADLGAQLTAAATFNVNFGVLLTPSLSDEQAFFLRDSRIQLETDLHVTSEPARMQLGFLETSATITAANLDLDLQITFNDLNRDVDHNITLEEFNGFDASTLADVSFNTNAVSATITSIPTIGSWTAPATPTLTVSGEANAIDVTLSSNSGFAEFANFANVDVETISESFDSLTDALRILGETRSFLVELPFLDGASPTFDIGTAFEEAVAPAFGGGATIDAESIAALSASLGVEIGYDASTDELLIPFAIDAGAQVLVADVNVEASIGAAKNIMASGSASVEATGTLDFELRLDVSGADTSIAERVSLHDMELDVEVGYEASGIEGTLEYGIVGLEFEGGSVSGDIEYSADLIDEMPLTNLEDLLDVSSYALDAPIVPAGDATFDLGDVSVMGNLFSLADTDIAFALDSATWTPEVAVGGSSILDSLAGVDVDQIVATLVDGIAETQNVTSYVEAWNEAVGVIPVVGDVISIVDPNDLLLVGDMEALLLHEVPAAMTSLPSLAELGAVVSVAVDKANETLEVSLNLEKSFTEELHFGLDFGEGLGDAIGDSLYDAGEFAGGGGSVVSDLSAELDVDVLLDVSQDEIGAYLLDSSAVTVSLFVNSDTEFDGSLGVLGAEFDGDLIVAGDVSNPTASSPATITSSLKDRADGRYALGVTELETESFADGQLSVDYAFTATPRLDAEADAFSFEIADLRDVANSLTVSSSPNFQGLMQDINVGKNLSAVPSALLDILDAIIQATNHDSGVFGVGFPIIGKLLAGDGNFLQDIYNKLATQFDKLTEFEPTLLESTLEAALANAFGIQNRDVFDIDLSNLDDVRLTLDLSGTALHLSEELNTDLGFKALGASLNTTFEMIGSYDAVLTFGLSSDPDVGVYLDTGNENLRLDVEVKLAGGGGEPDFEGWLGFVSVYVENVGDDTIFHGEYTIDLTEPSGDDKLTIAEALDAIGETSLVDRENSGLTAGTGKKAGDKIVLDVGVEVAEWAPSLYATLEIDWLFDGFGSNISPPTVEYSDVGIDLGGFIGRTFCPTIEDVSGFLDPLDGVVDLFETEVPVVSDAIDESVTILDMVKAAEVGLSFLPGAQAEKAEDNFKKLKQFVNVLTAIDELGDVCKTSSEARLSIGSLSFDGLASDVQEVGTQWLEENLDINPEDIIRQLEEEASDLVEATENVSLSGGKLEFPIWENPLSAFEWLLGVRHVPIMTLDVAQLTVDAELPLGFSLGPVSAGLKGSLLVDAGISIGYDTLGFSDYLVSGNVTDLFNGFYISDTAEADGSGDDVPQASVTGGLSLYAKAGIDGIISAEVEGGLYGNIELDLLDHNGDGRMRGFEFLDERGCIRIDGGLYIEASVEAEAFGLFEKEVPLGKPIDIARFDRTYYCKNTEARLADLDPTDGTLTLLVGAKASSREVSPDAIDEDYSLFMQGDELVISAFGASQSFDAALVTQIVADAGSGDDIIQISSGIDIDAVLQGGDGDDMLFSGGGDDTIDGGGDDDQIAGGDGMDIITTGGGEDIVDGGPGDDTITGSEDVDVLDGGDDDDTISGLGGNDLLFGSGGVDTIDGGPGEDRISGGPDNDILNGGDQDDEIFGDAGEDEIDGDGGDDYLDGGADADTISDSNGVTVAYGGSGDDIIDGGPLDDELHGGDDNDTIRGWDGEDKIYGDAGSDTIEGGNLADTIDGGPGNDNIRGNQGNDLLFGGDDADTISGDNGEDEIDGGPGSDPDLSGGPGNDVIRGGPGNDGIFGQGGEDELYGDSGDDDISGGPQDDFIDGMTGNDDLFGDDGEDEIFGDSGNDHIEGGSNDDWIEGGPGHDDIWGDGGEDDIFGDSGSDDIHGGTEDDILRGMTGNDDIYGDDGEDEIYADSGDDYVEGNAGRDHIEGGSGNDELHGNSEEDVMYGGDGNDEMHGEGANDQMFGNDDHDRMYGGPGRDVMHGDSGKDLMYGESGPDEMFGGLHNDTMRGGFDNDIMRGNKGDDLMLGNDGDDELYGEQDDDILRGNAGADRLEGGPGNDRGMGGDGDDIIEGDDGNDILNGEAGNDVISGEDGRDELIGGLGVDVLNGGENNDHLYAGEGVGNELRGGPGNDVIVGSDDGTDDPNLMDANYFGDVIFGDSGNDHISGLGGADIIDAGVGNDIVRGGTHGDLITGGPSATPAADKDTLFGDKGDDVIHGGADRDRIAGGNGVDSLNGGAANNQLSQNGVAPDPTEELADNTSSGHSATGNWKSIAGSASTDGLTQVGGLEEAIFAKGDRVYVAWVDTRNGNTEIHAAYHEEGQPAWVSLNGPGGVSDDEEQSRRPSIVATDNQVLVSWTSIDEDGTATIKVAVAGAVGGGWNVIGGYAGDHSRLAAYPHGAMLARIDNSGVARTEQYWACPGSSPTGGWIAGGGIGAPILPAGGLNVPRLEIDLATSGAAAGIATTYESDGESYIETYLAGPTISFPETCPDPTGPGVITIMVPRTARWDATPAITAENLSSPSIAIGNLREIVSGPNDTPKTEYEIDVHLAWDYETDYENQIDGVVATKQFAFGEPNAEPFEWHDSTSAYKSTSANAGGDSISDTIGYAEKPSLSGSAFGAFLAWMDDGVHQRRGDSRTAIYVLSAGFGGNTYTEELPGNASGPGISRNGGALQSLSISVDATEVDVEKGEELHRPYVGWTDAVTGKQQVYVRHDLNKSVPGVQVSQTAGKTLVSEDGQTDTYTLSLTSQPTSDVTIKILASDQLLATPLDLTFTPGDWAAPQTVTVTGLDNQAVEGNRVLEIDHQSSSTDADYDDIAVPELKVKIKDNDLNDDGRIDALDIDELFARANKSKVNGRNDQRFDVDDNGELNTNDVDFLVAETFRTTFGDSDLDGDVDFGDFLELAANFGRKQTGWSKGDTNGDGEVNFADFLNLAKNFGRRRG